MERFSSTFIAERSVSDMKSALPVLEKIFEWTPADVSVDSPQSVDNRVVSEDPRWFLQSMFHKDAQLWVGETYDSGEERHASQWRTCGEISNISNPRMVGPFTTPATWPVGCFSRSGANVLESPYVVLDFDEYNGKKPATPAEVETLKARARAIINWLRCEQRWKLAAIIDTGNKSLHAWFHSVPPDILDSLRTVRKVLGIDDALLGKPSQPCRLPGHPHPKSQNLSRVLWLQHPLSEPLKIIC